MAGTRQLSVAHIIPSIASEAAGPSYTVPALCNGLGAIGVGVELHVLEAGPDERYRGQHFELRRHARQPLLKPLDGSAAMKRALHGNASRLAAFHVHGLWRLPGLYAAQAAARAGKPLVISPRGMLEPAALTFSRTQKRVFWALGQGAALHAARCLHATSEGELLSLRRLHLRAPITLIENGVDLPARDCTRSPTGPKTMLYLGRVHPIKALDRLVEAWARLESSHRDWSLRIVGPDERGYGAELRAQCERLGVSRVTFRGAVYQSEKEEEFRAADLYVLPSHSENFGMTVAEALAQALPVIASKGTPWRELDSRGCGRWTDNSVDALTAALRGMLSLDGEERIAMGQRGRAWMQSAFSWGAKAKQMLETYEWLCGQRDRPPACVDLMNGSGRRRNRALGAVWTAW